MLEVIQADKKKERMGTVGPLQMCTGAYSHNLLSAFPVLSLHALQIGYRTINRGKTRESIVQVAGEDVNCSHPKSYLAWEKLSIKAELC